MWPLVEHLMPSNRIMPLKSGRYSFDSYLRTDIASCRKQVSLHCEARPVNCARLNTVRIVRYALCGVDFIPGGADGNRFLRC